MSLLYPAEAIPEADRCAECNGSGDRWAEVYCCAPGHIRPGCTCGGQPFMEAIDECPACDGTGLAPAPEAVQSAFTAYRSALAARCLFPRVAR